MHRLATVHAHDNQPTTNDVTTQPISISPSFTKVRRLKIRLKFIDALISNRQWTCQIVPSRSITVLFAVCI